MWRNKQVISEPNENKQKTKAGAKREEQKVLHFVNRHALEWIPRTRRPSSFTCVTHHFLFCLFLISVIENGGHKHPLLKMLLLLLCHCANVFAGWLLVPSAQSGARLCCHAAHRLWFSDDNCWGASDTSPPNLGFKCARSTMATASYTRARAVISGRTESSWSKRHTFLVSVRGIFLHLNPHPALSRLHQGWSPFQLSRSESGKSETTVTFVLMVYTAQTPACCEAWWFTTKMTGFHYRTLCFLVTDLHGLQCKQSPSTMASFLPGRTASTSILGLLKITSIRTTMPVIQFNQPVHLHW